jgi:hypothetical protein
VVGREIRVAFNPGDETVFDIDQHPTATMTPPTVTLDYLFFTRFSHGKTVLSLILGLYSFGLSRSGIPYVRFQSS